MPFYLSPAGNDANTGTLAAPWKTLAKARLAPAGSTINLLGGHYDAPPVTFTQPISLLALEPVTIESAIPAPVWTPVQLGAYSVWRATIASTTPVRQANWIDGNGRSHRIPL